MSRVRVGDEVDDPRDHEIDLGAIAASLYGIQDIPSGTTRRSVLALGVSVLCFVVFLFLALLTTDALLSAQSASDLNTLVELATALVARLDQSYAAAAGAPVNIEVPAPLSTPSAPPTAPSAWVVI